MLRNGASAVKNSGESSAARDARISDGSAEDIRGKNSREE
jgi:hypothetical protein